MNKTIILKNGIDIKTISCVVLYLSENSVSLSKEEMSKLDKIRENHELFFIYSKGAAKKVYPRKLANLFGAVGYTLGDNSEIEAINYSLIYLRNILQNFVSLSYFYIDGKNLSKVTEEDLVCMKKLSFSSLSSSVFKTSRMVYPKIQEISFKEDKHVGFLKKLLGSYKEDYKGSYSTHDTSDHILFIRSTLIEFIENFLDGMYDSKIWLTPKGFIDSFSNDSFSCFISSLLELHLSDDKNLSNKLNLNIRDAKS